MALSEDLGGCPIHQNVWQSLLRERFKKIANQQEDMPEERKRMISEQYTGAIDPGLRSKPDTSRNILVESEKPSRNKKPLMVRNQKVKCNRKKGTGQSNKPRKRATVK